MFAGTKRVHATLSWRRVTALRSLRRAHGQNKLSRRCDKRGNDVRVLDRTSFIPGTTHLLRPTYWGAMALLRDVVGIEVCPLVMVKVMKAFVRIVVDQDEQVLYSTVRVRAKRSSASCVRQSVPHSNVILNTCSAAK